MLTASPQIHTPADEPVDQSVLDSEARSVGHMFRDRVSATPDRPAYLHALVSDSGDEWVTVTWSELDTVVREIGAGLIALGVEPEDRVAIASSTRYEWALADLATMVAGGATTTIYPTTMADDVSFIVADSGAKVVFAENADQLEKFRSIRTGTPAVTRVVVFDGVPEADPWTLTLDEVRQLGREYLAGDPGAIDARIDGIRHDQLATIIYTSGTTGRPKGVRLRHGSWTYEGAAVASTGILSEDDLQYLWLPLAHVFGKVLLTLPLQIGFPTAIDGRIDKIVDNLAVVKPTFMGAAPRIFEKAYGRISTTMESEGGLKAKLFGWASGVGREVSELREQGQNPSGLLAVKYRVADTLIGTKIRERFGGRIRFFISGSAALNQDIARWFDSMGMQILEGYGMTETSAASFVNRPQAYRYGSVGWPLPTTEVRIAEDGEVLLRGAGNMEGYHNNPAGHGGDDRRRGLAAHRRHRRARRPRVPADHRPQEGPVQDQRRQVRRPLDHRVDVQGPVPLREPARRARCRPQLRVGARDAGPRRHRGLGGAERHGGQLVPRDRHLRRLPRDGAGVRRPAQRRAQPVGDDQEVHHPRQRPHGRGRRAHPEPEAQAQGRRRQVQAPPRRPLHELTPAAPRPAVSR